MQPRNKVLANVAQWVRKAKTEEQRQDYILTFNALGCPRMLMAWKDNELHVILIRTENTTWTVPSTLFHTVDVIWHFNPVTGVWNTVKDRTGLFEPLCPITTGVPG